ncbi:hypothetical protein SAY87_019792 [Trapa incisa]|uniref:Uncharacterized protein n=1 Tax=Trapa incisa TaxID=236973 RepID=A0AAN7Q2Q1_9MYRT|nr:hypothetical protein SAY87_019792 [Trapa incisa]
MIQSNLASYSNTLAVVSAPQQHQQQEVLSNFTGLRMAEQEFNAFRDFNSSSVGSSSTLRNRLSLSLSGAGFQMSLLHTRNQTSEWQNPLKAAQQLLDEVTNAFKQPEDAKSRSGDENRNNGRARTMLLMKGRRNDGGDSRARDFACKELSHPEKQELQNKLINF